MMMSLSAEFNLSNGPSGLDAAQARIRQLQALKAVLVSRAQARHLPLNKATFRQLLQEQLTQKAQRQTTEALQQATGTATPKPMDFYRRLEEPTLAHGLGKGAKVLRSQVQAFPFAGPGLNPSVHGAVPAMAQRRNQLAPLISELANKHQLDPHLVHAVVQQESGYKPHAVSRSGALGLMQLMPKTAASLGVKNPLNPMQNLEGGIQYLKAQLQRFGGSLPLALAAYNAGPNAVVKHGGIPPYKETRHYVRTILAGYLKNKLNGSATV